MWASRSFIVSTLFDSSQAFRLKMQTNSFEWTVSDDPTFMVNPHGGRWQAAAHNTTLFLTGLVEEIFELDGLTDQVSEGGHGTGLMAASGEPLRWQCVEVVEAPWATKSFMVSDRFDSSQTFSLTMQWANSE